MSTTTLTERYVNEVVRRLPADQRDDIADELRAMIADTVEARDPAGAQSAEREVLTEMGDPIRYAARYTDRPLALIGPDYYPTYVRLLTLLLSTVLPAITVVFVLMELADTQDVGAAVGEGVSTVLTVGAQMIAGLTVVFALAERVRNRDGELARTADWTLDDLPEERQPDKGGVVACAGAAWYTLLISLIVWQHVAKPFRADGDSQGIEVLDPALWSGWIWPVLVGLAGMLAVSLARVTARGWTVRLAVLNAVAQAVFALPLAWVLHRRLLFNPDFLEVAGTDALTQQVYSGAAVIVLVMGVSAVVTGFRSVRR
ncbi:HAAS signaling domain-containing protein [Streptomyces sp. NPDC018000]|uniref:HAAS signaling domain-containing protein n=1 Tax=Streptomyces sp. NPDC018000 TaxID=3365028 RepID=UPI0037902252